MATFVAPLIETDSEVLGRTHWSPLQVMLALQAGSLPIDQTMLGGFVSMDINVFIAGVGITYLLLSLIAAASVFLPSARFVGSASAICLVYGLGRSGYGYSSGYSYLQSAIYGAPRAFASGHMVHAGLYYLTLTGVLGLLCFIAAAKQLD